jgi:hypothetical protein
MASNSSGVHYQPLGNGEMTSYFSVKRDSRPNDGALRVDLERGKTFTVAATGEASITSFTVPDADPFPGVVLFYGTDEEDGYAVRQTVFTPGKSITFQTLGPSTRSMRSILLRSSWTSRTKLNSTCRGFRSFRARRLTLL